MPIRNFDAATLARINTGFQTIYREAFAGSAPMWDRVAERVNSTALIESYAWLQQLPGLREWIGSRVIERMVEEAYTLRNRLFEDTVAVARTAIEDDRVGTYSMAVRGLARAAAEHPDELVFAALAGGFANPCYDGQNFFDTDHPLMVNGVETSASNMQAGAGPAWFLLQTNGAVKPLVYQDRISAELDFLDDPAKSDHVFTRDEVLWGARSRGAAGYSFWQLAYGSKADLTPANFDAARTAMMARRGDRGRPLNVRPNLLVVPPELETAAEEVLVKERTTGGETNIHRGKAEIMVTNWLNAA